MFKFDVYNKPPKKSKEKAKKLGTHKYPTLKEAEAAAYCIQHMPRKEYKYIPREGAKEVKRTLGGYTTSAIEEC